MTQDRPVEKTSNPATSALKYDRNVAKTLASKVDRPIVLVGMMGSGKSRVGQLLSQILELPFIDCDKEIETAAGCSISDYFERYGEDAFRDGESRVMRRILDDGEPKIVSSGGGIVIRDETRLSLKEKSICVWLQADIDVLAARCASNDKRPLLHGTDPAVKLRELYPIRAPLYAEVAAFNASSNQEDANETVAEVLDGLRTYFKVA
ncbi:MAG TPA: shikimate kinase [Alphaproteobacteria bacterium]